LAEIGQDDGARDVAAVTLRVNGTGTVRALVARIDNQIDLVLSVVVWRIDVTGASMDGDFRS